MQNRDSSQQRRYAFLTGAALMIAHQVAGKALRDGLFLSRFAPADLPKAIAAAALVAVVLGLAFTRILARTGPLRLVPAAFATGAVLHLVEFAVLRSGGESVRAAAVTVVYLHLVGFGSVLLSGFWSVANEVFDAREAKRQFGRIAGAGTIGGIAGGLLAERISAWFGAEPLLLVLGVLHLSVAMALRLGIGARTLAAAPSVTDRPWQAARDAFRQAPFLVNLAALILIGSVSAALLDYLFKSSAAAAWGRGPELTRYFALFYTGSQILTALVQNFVTPVALRRLGLGRTMQWHPGAVAMGAGASILAPFAMIPAARALEIVLRGSFLRSSYELFFTPVPPREKRATKMFIDVSCDRLGDALGGVMLYLLLLIGPARAATPILLLAATLGLAGFCIARRMDAAYSRVIEHGLLSRSLAVNEVDVQDSTTLAALLHTTTAFHKRPAARQIAPPPAAAPRDQLLSRVADLRSGDPRRVRAALAPDQPFDAILAPIAIRLLAWDDVFEWSRAFLLRHAHRMIGQLVDELLDRDQDPAVRRRIPHILAYTTSQRAVDGLTAALDDPRFEIRFNASRALEFLHRMGVKLRFDIPLFQAAVDRELSTSRRIWAGRKLLDSRDRSDSQYAFLDEVLRDRADKSLEHVFSLLAVYLPLDPLKAAFRALHSPDRLLHALALEFLESRLSARSVSLLRRLVEPPIETPPDRGHHAAAMTYAGETL